MRNKCTTAHNEIDGNAGSSATDLGSGGVLSEAKPTTVEAEIPDRLERWMNDYCTRSGEAAMLDQLLPRVARLIPTLMRLELRHVGFTIPEATLLADTFRGCTFSLMLVNVSVADGFRDGTPEDELAAAAARLGFDDADQLNAFLDRLDTFGPTVNLAIAEAISKWWKLDARGRDVSRASFGKVGLQVFAHELDYEVFRANDAERNSPELVM